MLRKPDFEQSTKVIADIVWNKPMKQQNRTLNTESKKKRGEILKG